MTQLFNVTNLLDIELFTAMTNIAEQRNKTPFGEQNPSFPILGKNGYLYRTLSKTEALFAVMNGVAESGRSVFSSGLSAGKKATDK